MPVSDTRLTVLEVINEVERKLGLTPSDSLTTRDLTRVLLRLLNETVADLNDFGDWAELYGEYTVTAQSTALLTIAPSGKTVHHLHEVRYGREAAPLIETSMSDIRRLSSVSNGRGTPRQWAMRSVNASADPVIQVWPVPSTALAASSTWNVSFYEKVRQYTTDDGAVVPPFDATVMIAGVYARSLFEEQSGEPSRQAITAQAEYERRKREFYNRYRADSGTAFKFVPNGRRWGRR